MVDRLHVVPAGRRGDGAIRDTLCGYLQREREFEAFRIRYLDAWALFAVDEVVDEIDVRG